MWACRARRRASVVGRAAAWRKFYLAFVGLFAFSLLIALSPTTTTTSNHLLLVRRHLRLVAAWLVRIATTRARRALASCSCSGRSPRVCSSAVRELQAAKFSSRAPRSKPHASPASRRASRAFPHRAVVHQPVLALAGRAVLRGENGLGLESRLPFRRTRIGRAPHLRGPRRRARAPGLYQIDYVYLGARERENAPRRRGILRAKFPVAYSGDGVRIYDARRGRTVTTRAALYPQYHPREYAARVDKDPHQLLVEFPRASSGFTACTSSCAGARRSSARSWRTRALWARARELARRGGASGSNRTSAPCSKDIARREEFAGLYGAADDDVFVAALYRNAGLNPSRARMVNS
jgi:hypothetical protein